MKKNLIQELVDELSKLPDLTEIIINKLDAIYIERNGEMILLENKITEAELEEYCQALARFNKREFNSEHPVFDGNLPDGSRVNIIHKDYARYCHAVTIRRYLKTIKNFDSAKTMFSLDQESVKFMKAIVASKMNILVSGGTGVGKTTFLNMLLNEVSQSERIITIEDTRELQFQHLNSVRLESRPNEGLSTRDLLKNSLRMRPDRIIVGEVRGAEAFDLLQAMNTGHEGSMCSLHANSPREAIIRLENLFLMAGFDIPTKALRYQISSSINFIIQLKRDKDGKRHIAHVCEVGKMEGDMILVQDIGLYKDQKFRFNGLVPSCIDRLVKVGLEKDFFNRNQFS